MYLNRDLEQAEAIKNCESLTAEDQEMIQNWLVDYQAWKEKSEKVDYPRSNRERSAAQAIAMILVGFPIYLFHWTRIKKDRKIEQ